MSISKVFYIINAISSRLYSPA